MLRNNYKKVYTTRMTEDTFNILRKHDTKHYKVYYAYACYFINKDDIKNAKENIDKSIEFFDHSNDLDLLLYLDTLEIKDVKKSKLYQLAAYIYAYTSDTKALEFYRLFQYQSQLEYMNDVYNTYPQNRFILYSFRNYSTYSLEDLINRTVTFAQPSQMNDPFDTIATEWSRQYNLDDICKGKHHIPYYSKSYDYYRIRSFVANKTFSNCDKRVFGNLLMWSHYADSHKGYCVKYNLSKDFVLHNEPDLCKTRIILPIDYPKDKFSLKKTSITFKEAYRTKAKVWKPEKEVRLLSYDPTKDTSFISEKLDSDSWISEIAFGYKCPQSTIDTVCNIFKEDKRIRFVKMDVDESIDMYKLIPQKL